MRKVNVTENAGQLSFDEGKVTKMWKTMDWPLMEIWNYDGCGSQTTAWSTPENDCT
jgi:hypothetical protein